MASTRSNAPAEPPTTAFLTLVRRGARFPIAAATTATRTFNHWAQSADRFAQTLGDELLRRVDGDTDSAQVAARVTTAASTHVRELTALARAAADHFDMRLARVPTANKEA